MWGIGWYGFLKDCERTRPEGIISGWNCMLREAYDRRFIGSRAEDFSGKADFLRNIVRRNHWRIVRFAAN
jgi:hypothetical protein